MVLSINLDYLLVYTLDGLPELRSGSEEIFLDSLFEKNPKLIIFHLNLHSKFTGLKLKLDCSQNLNNVVQSVD